VSADGGGPVIRVENLCLGLASGDPVVQDVSFAVHPGEILGLVGESGSGKTTTALALLGYTRPGVVLRSGAVEVGGEPIMGAGARAVRSLRGRVVSYVPQDPGGALNPSLRVGDAIMDVLRAHRSEAASQDSVHTALDRVELGADPRFGRRYPHQLSGGQQQRVTIAMACVCGPPVAVLDEPTTGLDVLTQDRILTELTRLRSEEGMAMVYVSHDLAVVARMADRIVVMYAGRVVEHGPVGEVIERPRHPYTRALVGAIPDHRRPRALQGIPGVAVGVGEWPPGCAFAPRCEFAEERCGAAVPALDEAAPGHAVRCVRWNELEPAQAGPQGARAATAAGDGAALLEVAGLSVEYRSERGRNLAVRDVSFAIEAGRCVALVGESGRRIQIIFQNPFESLNPRHRVGASIERPLRVLRRLSRADAEREVEALLERVRLPARVAHRFPVELSGGERQRVAIARALAAKPDLLVCDEVTSALDVSVQAAVLELLTELQRELHLSMLFITHNLGVVACVSDTVLVMDRGSLCEAGTVTDVLSRPSDDYTRRLLGAAPCLPDRAVG